MSPRIFSRACAATGALVLALTGGLVAATPAFAAPSPTAALAAAEKKVARIVVTVPETFVVGESQHAWVSAQMITGTGSPRSAGGSLTFTDQKKKRLGTYFVRGDGAIPFGENIAVGSHTITATFSSEGVTATYSFPVTVTAAPVFGSPAPGATSTTTDITLDASTITAGEDYAVSAQVTATTGIASGEAVLLVDGAEAASATLDAAGEAVFDAPALTSAGDHEAQIVYRGSDDGTIAGSSSAVEAFSAQLAPVRVSLAGNDTSVAGAPAEFSIRVAAASSSNTLVPSGLVYLTSDSELAGYGMLDATGVATFTGGMAEPGATDLVARYAGDDSFAGDVSSAKAYAVTPASTRTTATLDASAIGVGDGATLDVAIAIDASSTLTLQGRLEILIDDDVVLTEGVGVGEDIVAVDGLAKFSFTTTEIPAGDRTFSARFTSGTAGISSSESERLAITSTPYSSTVGLNTTDLSVAAGERAVVTAEVVARPIAPVAAMATSAQAATGELPLAWGTVQAFVGDKAVSKAVAVEDEPVAVQLDVLGAGEHQVQMRYVSSTERVADSVAAFTVTVAAAATTPDAGGDELAHTGQQNMAPLAAAGLLALLAGGFALARARMRTRH